MLDAPKRPEIDHRTIKLLVGVIALTLADLTSFFSDNTITSISASYYEGGWSQSIFIGFLFAIAALLLAYNGRTRNEMILSKIASFAAMGVALFPCGCDGHGPSVPYVHYASAAVMFIILAFFSYGFYKRARAKGHREANLRATVYALCCATIVAAIFALGLDHFLDNVFSNRFARFTFYGEASGLDAFGLSWLIASHVLPVFTRANERFSPLSNNNPK